MNLEKLSIPELNELQVKITKEIAQRKIDEKQKLISDVAAMVEARGFALDDIIGGAKTTKKGQRKPATIKYRNPQNPELTWSGRGRQPGWIKAWLAEDKSIDKLAV